MRICNLAFKLRSSRALPATVVPPIVPYSPGTRGRFTCLGAAHGLELKLKPAQTSLLKVRAPVRAYEILGPSSARPSRLSASLHELHPRALSPVLNNARSLE